MLEAKVLFDCKGEQKELRQTTVAEAINLTELFYQKDRSEIMADLDDAQVSPSDRLECLRKHAENRGLATYLARNAMRVDRAKEIISLVCKDADEWIDILDPISLSELALRCLGHEIVEENENDANPQTTVEKAL